MSLTHRVVRAALVRLLGGVLAVLALAACGDNAVPRGVAATGASGNVGSLKLRDAVLSDPGADSEFPGYDRGEDAPLLVTIVNYGDTDDELVSVTTAAAERVTVEGATTIPAGGSVSSIPDADNPLPAPAWAVPSQPIGDPIDGAELSIVLRDLTTEIPPGVPTDVTFHFRQAGEVTLRVPVCTPTCTETR
ncbi:MAG: copper chaperone PCu(A)C [Actinomycetota bacterium]|nr:copper chaperone PCu(A)C [Actinomycetota bacterium]